MACSHASEECLRAEFNVVHDLQSECVIAQKNVDTKETNQAEVAEGPVERLRTKVPNDLAETKIY